MIRATFLSLLLSASVLAGTINFDSLNDGDLVTNQFAGQGVTFLNGIVLASGVSLNEFEFPPHSNFNVISDNGGPISIFFSTPQPSVFAFFTYLQPLSLQAFDGSNTLLGSVSSAGGCTSNTALSGTPGCLPNEQLSLSGIGLISSVVITGNAAGGSFVLDDLNFPINGTTPEPSTWLMLAGGLSALVLYRLQKQRSR